MIVTQRLTVAAIAAALSITPLAAQQPLTVERIWGSEEFRSDLIAVRWAPDGGSFSHVEATAGGTDLYLTEAETGNRERLVRGVDLVPAGANAPIQIEDYEFSADRSKLLIFTNSIRVWRVNTKGEYYVWDLDAQRLYPVSREGGYQQFAKFSPDGRRVGFVRENNLFVAEYASGREWQITTDGSDDVINGTADWVYEEELGLRDGFRISPDGQLIAFWRLDQSVIRPFYLIDETLLYPELQTVRYPKAGVENSEVRIGIANIETGRTVWVDLGADTDIYVARMGFAHAPDEIWLTRLNRHQNRMDLLLADASTGESRVVMTDTDEAWVDNREPIWFANGQEFLYLSDRDGYTQVYRSNRNGSGGRKITTAAWDVLQVFGIDEDRRAMYFTGAGEGPLERPIYRIGLDGDGLQRLTPEPGTHAANFNPTFTHFVDTYSRADTPPVQYLRSADGEIVRTVAQNRTQRDRVSALGIASPEFIEVAGADGTTLNAYLIKPPHFDSSSAYPLLMYVYGGPGSQTVTDAWGGDRYLWHQMLAQQGYVVASVDNRGTGARGRDFEKATYLRLGQLEAADQIVAARALGALPYIDEQRIGIWGWSYGGYMSLLSLFRGNDVFRAGVSVAPVTDWRLYDTIYTERYMRTPSENAEGYERGAPISYVDSLMGDLLVVHGTGDDNVHSQQTTQLIVALEEAGKQFDMRLYPNKTHAIAGQTSRVNLYGLFAEWLRDHLYAPRSVGEQVP